MDSQAAAQPHSPNHSALAELEEANVLERQAEVKRAAALRRLNPVMLAGLGKARAHARPTGLDMQVCACCRCPQLHEPISCAGQTDAHLRFSPPSTPQPESLVQHDAILCATFACGGDLVWSD